jgi:hypothetical protein
MAGKIKKRIILAICLLISFEVSARVIRASGTDSLNFQTGGNNTRAHIDSSGSFFFDLLTANRVPYIGASGELLTSAVTDTELGYLSGVTSSLQTQIDNKICASLTDSNIIIGNGTNVATAVPVTGDISITNAGLVSISSNAVSDAEVASSANINATKLGTGVVDNTEFNRLNGLVGDILTTSSTSTVSNKTFSDALLLTELVSTPSTPAAGLKKLYCLTDDKCYQLNDAGVQVELGSGGGGAAKIGQIIQTVKTNSFSTTSTTFVDVTGMSATITPTSASNQVLVLINIPIISNSADRSVSLKALRGATVLTSNTDGGLADTDDAYMVAGGGGLSDNPRKTHSGDLVYLDSPSTTSATTYKIQIKTDNAAGTAYINRWGLNTDAASVSTITLIEILN